MLISVDVQWYLVTCIPQVQILKALYDGVGLLKAEEDKFDAKIAVTSPLKG